MNKEYLSLISRLGSEFEILTNIPVSDIEVAGSLLLSEAISRMREGKVRIAPGYDGEYGKIRIFEKVEREETKGQRMLF